MKKKSAYQKLKAKNAELQQDLLVLVDEKHERHLDVKHKWAHQLQISRMLSYGNSINRATPFLDSLLNKDSGIYNVTIQGGKSKWDSNK